MRRLAVANASVGPFAKLWADESALFEALTLGVFQVGLSWKVVFSKRDAFMRAFHGFDIGKTAAMADQDVDRLLQDPSIIRNRGKIRATIDNARTMRSATPTLAALARSHATDRARSPRSAAEVPTTTPGADALAKELKSQGYRFVGPTSVYAFMQNTGMVNDHIHGCFRASDYRAP
jgi:DNA-3-methyladenine glycosylase I